MVNVITLDLGGVNCYLVEKSKQFILIDTGGHMFMDKEYDGRLERLKQQLVDNGVTGNNLNLLVLTHGDCDHVFNAAYIQREYNVPVTMGKKDAWMVQNQEWDCYKVNSKYSSKVVSFVFYLLNKKIEKLMKKVYSEFEIFTPDLMFTEGDTLEKYGYNAKIYSTPGHTEGSISILDEEGNLFCGDLWANNNKPSVAMNAQDFNVLEEQVKRLTDMSIKTIYPGHGRPFEVSRFKH